LCDTFDIIVGGMSAQQVELEDTLILEKMIAGIDKISYELTKANNKEQSGCEANKERVGVLVIPFRLLSVYLFLIFRSLSLV
jgi:hypothetical protein